MVTIYDKQKLQDQNFYFAKFVVKTLLEKLFFLPKEKIFFSKKFSSFNAILHLLQAIFRSNFGITGFYRFIPKLKGVKHHAVSQASCNNSN